MSEKTRSGTLSSFLRRGTRSKEDVDVEISGPKGPMIVGKPPVDMAVDTTTEDEGSALGKLAGLGGLLGGIDDDDGEGEEEEQYLGNGYEEEEQQEGEENYYQEEEQQEGEDIYYQEEGEEEEEGMQQLEEVVVEELPMEVVSPPAKKDPWAARTSIAKEILSTEKTYVESLQLLKTVFEMPLRESLSQAKPVIEEKHVRTIFAHLDPIVAYSGVLYEKLTKQVGGDAFDPRATLLGPIFMELGFFLKTYSLYVNNFAAASECIQKLQTKNTRFKEFLSTCKQDPRTLSKGIIDFLIMPVQRIPRYSLLLADLLRHTPADHPDVQSLTSALARINEVATFINECKASVDDFVLLSQMQSRLIFDGASNTTNWSLTLGRRKIMREESCVAVTFVDGQPSQENGLVFLFSDCIILCVKGRKKTLNVRKWLWLQECSSVEPTLAVVADASEFCIRVVVDAERVKSRVEETAAVEAGGAGASIVAEGPAPALEEGMVTFVVASLTGQGLVKRQVRVLGTATVGVLMDEFGDRAGGAFDSSACKLLLKGEVMDVNAQLSTFQLTAIDILHLVPEKLSATAFPALPTVSSPQASKLKLSIETVKEVVRVNPHSRPSMVQLFASAEPNILFFLPDTDREASEYFLKQLVDQVEHCRAHPVNIVKMQTSGANEEAVTQATPAPAEDTTTTTNNNNNSAAEVSSPEVGSFSASSFFSSVLGMIGGASPSAQRRGSRTTLRADEESSKDSPKLLKRFGGERSASSSSIPSAIGLSSSPPVTSSTPPPPSASSTASPASEDLRDSARSVLRAYTERPVPKPPVAKDAEAKKPKPPPPPPSKRRGEEGTPPGSPAVARARAPPPPSQPRQRGGDPKLEEPKKTEEPQDEPKKDEPKMEVEEPKKEVEEPKKEAAKESPVKQWAAKQGAAKQWPPKQNAGVSDTPVKQWGVKKVAAKEVPGKPVGGDSNPSSPLVKRPAAKEPPAAKSSPTDASGTPSSPLVKRAFGKDRVSSGDVTSSPASPVVKRTSTAAETATKFSSPSSPALKRAGVETPTAVVAGSSPSSPIVKRHVQPAQPVGASPALSRVSGSKVGSSPSSPSVVRRWDNPESPAPSSPQVGRAAPIQLPGEGGSVRAAALAKFQSNDVPAKGQRGAVPPGPGSKNSPSKAAGEADKGGKRVVVPPPPPGKRQ